MKYFIGLLRRFVYNTKLVQKYMYLVVFLMLAEIFIFNFYIRSNASDMLTERIETTSDQFLESYVGNISYRLQNYNKLLEAMANSGTLQGRFRHKTLMPSDYTALDRKIREILNAQYPYGFYDIAFYPMNRCSSGYSVLIRGPEQITEDLQEKIEEKDFRRYYIDKGEFVTEQLFVLYPIYSDDELVCVIRLVISPKVAFRAIRGVEGQDAERLFIIDSDGEFVYGSQFSDTQEYLDYIKTYAEKWYSRYEVEPFDGTDGRYLTSTYSTGGFRAVYYIPHEETKAQIGELNRVLGIGLVVLTAITLGASFALSWHLERRFDRVLGKIKSVSEGNLDIGEAVPAADEIGIFDNSFTHMIGRVRELIDKNYVSEVKKKDAQLLALQAQIQPHFLFNSLEIINSLIEIGQHDTAVEVNTRLSSLLRYSINYNSSGVVTLREEIAYMKDYLYIQNLRFGGKYQFHEEVDRDCLCLPMMKLILQPLVENSIQHGFGKRSAGNICFSAARDGECFVIEIRDDGNGMEKEEYERLMEKLRTDPTGDFQEQTESIGIINIHSRLRLKYGEAYQLQIHTAPGQGMRTILFLPILEDSSDAFGGEKDEIIDRG